VWKVRLLSVCLQLTLPPLPFQPRRTILKGIGIKPQIV
jgi:hypothetical protein